jgi:hypothetical protein
MNIENNIKLDYGLIYADSFTDAVDQLEHHIYGESLMNITSMELFDTHAALSKETFKLVKKDLEIL